MKVLRSKNVTTDVTGLKQARAAVVFTPGSLFFTHVMEWPEGLGGEDLAAFVALGLEEVSPFALDSLAWGFCCDETSRTLFLYAACLPRISVGEQEQWPLADHVYPAFLPLLAKREQTENGGAQVRFELLLTGREVLLLEYPAGSRWPRRLNAAALDAASEAPEQDALAAAERLLVKASLARDAAAARVLIAAAGNREAGQSTGSAALAVAVGKGARASVSARSGGLSLWKFAGARQSKRGEIRFALQHWDVSGFAEVKANAGSAAVAATAAHPQPAGAKEAETGRNTSALLQAVLGGEEALWQADLRDEGFIALARKRRVADLRLWYGLCAAAATAVVLLLLLVVFGWLGSVLNERTATLTAQGAAVERVRQDQDLLLRMRQFSADPFEPFSLIAALKSTKPDPIYFDSIELSGPDSVTVEGQGPTVDSVNAYVRALEQNGGYRAARQARMNLKDGASVFTLYLQYLGQPATNDAMAQRSGSAVDAAQPEGNATANSASARRPGGQTAGTNPYNATTGQPEQFGSVVEEAAGTAGAGDIFFQPELVEGMTEHRVAEGETIAQIAERYELPISMILVVNPELDPLGLEEGQTVIIPVPAVPILPLPLPEN